MLLIRGYVKLNIFKPTPGVIYCMTDINKFSEYY
jgi:hypothetical protein